MTVGRLKYDGASNERPIKFVSHGRVLGYCLPRLLPLIRDVFTLLSSGRNIEASFGGGSIATSRGLADSIDPM